jgi:hypothetical protein
VSPKLSLSLIFPHQDPVHAYLLSHRPARYVPRPSNFSRFYHPNIIGLGLCTPMLRQY